MKRGEIWTVSGGGYAGKPRPAVIIQSDRFEETRSITICIFTTFEPDAPPARLSIAPSAQNGLRVPCYLMVDKITTIPKTQLGNRIGELEAESMTRLNRAVFVFLELGTQSARRRASYGRSS
jgi:mRNA interferase MazF